MKPNREVILATLDKLPIDGRTIWPVDDLVRLGHDRAFVESLAETYCDDPDDPDKRLQSPLTGKPIEQVRGVHELDMLRALAKMTNADTSTVTAFGFGTRARQYADAIRLAAA